MATEVTWRGTTDNSWNTASNWSDAAVPIAGDNVSIPAGSPNITSGLDQSAVALGTYRVETGFNGMVGDNTTPLNPTYLQLNCTSFESYGTGTFFYDLVGGGAPNVVIVGTAGASAGRYGCYIKGTGTADIGTLEVRGGTIGLAPFIQDAIAVATIHIIAGSCVCGSGVEGAAVRVDGGIFLSHAPAGAQTWGAIDQTGGMCTFNKLVGAGAFNVSGGLSIINATSSTHAFTIDGGTLDISQTAIAKTLSSVKLTSGTFKYDGDNTTITAWLNAPGVLRLQGLLV